MANSNGWGDGSVNNNIGWGQGANNATGWGKSHLNSWSGATDIDGGNPPVNSVAPALSGTAQEGQTLTCSTGTWSGSPTYTYQWKRNGNNITSATSSTYTLVTADVGTSIKCTVTATNFAGSGTADSNTIVPTSSVDADAQAFITAASITDPTQQSAINQLVVDLKGYSIWTKFQALYPMVGGVSTSHAVNLKTPGTFNLTFSGGWTHSSTGATPNGTNGYADTGYKPSVSAQQNSHHLSYYSRTDQNTNTAEIGASIFPGGYDFLQLRVSGLSYYGLNTLTSFDTYSNSNAQGFYIANRTASNDQDLFKSGVKVKDGTATSYNPLVNINIYIGAINNNGSAAQYSAKQCAFASIGDGLTDTEAANFYTAVQTFQTTLSRNV